MHYLLPTVLLLVLTVSNSLGQSTGLPFEGIVTYSYARMDSASNPLFYPIMMEEDRYSKTSVITKVISGDFLRIVGDMEMFLDAEKGIRYEINHDDKAIRNLGKDVLTTINVIETHAAPVDTTIQGFRCKGISFSGVYVDALNARTDTIKWTYFIAPDLSIPHARLLATLQGNRNTKWLDGRFEAIPLRIVSERSNGEKLICTAVRVRRLDSNEQIELPDYKID